RRAGRMYRDQRGRGRAQKALAPPRRRQALKDEVRIAAAPRGSLGASRPIRQARTAHPLKHASELAPRWPARRDKPRLRSFFRNPGFAQPLENALALLE